MLVLDIVGIAIVALLVARALDGFEDSLRTIDEADQVYDWQSEGDWSAE